MIFYKDCMLPLPTTANLFFQRSSVSKLKHALYFLIYYELIYIYIQLKILRKNFTFNISMTVWVIKVIFIKYAKVKTIVID